MHTAFLPGTARPLSRGAEAAPVMSARPVQSTPGHEVDLLLAAELLDPRSRPSSLPEPSGLQVCPHCSKPFVVPGEVRQLVGVNRVRLELACSNCGWASVEVHEDTELASLEIALDRSFADLLWTLEVVWIANEEGAIERFAEALQADQIVPEDF
jgi:hypothetical protein